MKTEPEPFSTHRPWDAETHEAYRDLPTRNGAHFQLDEDCSPAEIEAYRVWCRKWPRHWPGHVRHYISERKRKAAGDR